MERNKISLHVNNGLKIEAQIVFLIKLLLHPPAYSASKRE